jgi:hypothetical protein
MTPFSFVQVESTPFFVLSTCLTTSCALTAFLSPFMALYPSREAFQKSLVPFGMCFSDSWNDPFAHPFCSLLAMRRFACGTAEPGRE